jgi:hypothetical protein
VAGQLDRQTRSWLQTSTRPVSVVVAPPPGRWTELTASPPAPPPATAWTVVVETAPAVAPTTVELDAFRRALRANPAAREPAASFDHATGALAAQFQLVADSREAAALRGSFAYWGASAAAGVAIAADSTVLVAPLEDAGSAVRFSARAQLRRD